MKKKLLTHGEEGYARRIEEERNEMSLKA